MASRCLPAQLQSQQAAQVLLSARTPADCLQVSYAEFAAAYKSVIKSHKKSLLSVRSFWQTLSRHEVKFTSIVRSLQRIDTTQYQVRTQCL